jgi:hypothetical protein
VSPTQRLAGLERWFLNDTEIPLVGALELPGTTTRAGVTVRWDLASGEVDLATRPPPPGTSSPEDVHVLLRYSGKDPFGTEFDRTYPLYLNTCGSNSLKEPIRDFYRIELPDPVPEMATPRTPSMTQLPSREQLTRVIAYGLSEQTGSHPAVWQLAEVMVTALREGQAKLNARSARIALAVLGRAAPGAGATGRR